MNKKILLISSLIGRVDRDFAKWVVGRINSSDSSLRTLTGEDFIVQAKAFYTAENAFCFKEGIEAFINRINPNLFIVLSYEVLVDIYREAQTEALRCFFKGGGEDKLKEFVQ